MHGQQHIKTLIHVQFADQSSSTPVDNNFFRICINLVQFTRSIASCKSMKQAHRPSSAFEDRSDIILNIQTAFLVPISVSHLKPNLFSASRYSIFFSSFLPTILATIL